MAGLNISINSQGVTWGLTNEEAVLCTAIFFIL